MTAGEYGNDDGGVPNVGNPYSTPPLSFLPPAVIPAVFKRESILDYAGVNPAYSNWISAYKACPCRL